MSNPISYKELFDIDGLDAALKDLEQSEKQFANAVGADLKRMSKEASSLEKSLRSIKTALNEVNITNQPGKDELRKLIGESDKYIQTLEKQNAAIQAGKKILADLAKETSRLKKEYEALDLATKKEKLSQEELNTAYKKTRLEITQYTLATKQGTAVITAAQGSYREAQQRMTALGKSIREAEGAFESQTPAIKAQISEYNALNERLKAFDAQMGNHYRNVGNYASGFNGLQNSINQLTREFPAFTYSVQTGFMALSNNIPIFFDQIKQTNVQIKAMRAEGQQVPGLFRQLMSATFSWGTALSLLITLTTVFGDKIGKLFMSLFKGKESIDQAKISIQTLFKALESPQLTETVKDIEELKINIDLAKKGLVDKEAVLLQYNETIGKTTGEVKSLNEAEQAMTKNAKAYVEMTLYKASAQLALEDAAKKSLEIEKKRRQEAEDFANHNDKVDASLAATGGLAGSQFGIANFDAKTYNKAFIDAANKRRDEEIKIDQEAKDAQLSIAQDFLKKAAEIRSKIEKQIRTPDDELISVEDIKKRIEELQKIDGSAIKGSELYKRIEALKSRLKEVKVTTDDVKVGFEAMEEQLKQLGLQIEIQFLKGNIDGNDKLVQSYRKLKSEIDTLKQSYDELLNPKNRQFLAPAAVSPGDVTIPDFSKFDEAQAKKENDKFFKNEIAKNDKALQDLETLHLKKLISEDEYQVRLFAIQRYGLTMQQGLYKEESNEYKSLTNDKLKADEDYKKKKIEKEREVARLVTNFLKSNIESISGVFGDEFGRAFSEMTDALDTFLQSSENGLEKWQNQAIFAFQTFNAASKMVTASAIADSQLRISQLEQERQVEIEGAGDNAEARKRIEQDYNRRIAQERRKQAIAEKNQAMFSIAINTASAIAATIGKLGIFGIPLTWVVGALGLAQLALVAAKPIPQFYKGTDFSPEGLAEVAERGPEIIEGPDGKRRLASKRQVTYLERGSKVFTAEQTSRMIREGQLDQDLEKMTEYNLLMHNAGRERIDYDRLIKGIGQEIKKIPFDEHYFDDRGYTRYRNEAGARIQDINARNSRMGRG